MNKILIIAEKPSVARDIAKVLGCRQKGDGYIEGETHIVTWAIGHLVTLNEPEDFDPKLKRWSFDSLPILPADIGIKPYPKTLKQLKTIQKLMQRKDVASLVCATDSGREGELIFRYIYQYCQCRKPFDRLWISSMTDQAIREGFAKIKPGRAYDNLYLSARCRSEADWLVGINATRAYTTKNGVLLSIGRVQTPTLALIVGRQAEIDEFKPEDYYEVAADFGTFTGTWFDGKPSETRIPKEEAAAAIAEKVKGREGSVLSMTRKKNKQLPPQLYDLTELQRDGNKLYGYTAKRVLDIAQALYEKRKLITYPRTDSRYLSSDMKGAVKATLSKLAMPPYEKAVAKVLEKELPFSKRIIDDSKVTDHHAIIPADARPKLDTLSKDELNIYNLIVKRLLAVFYDPFVFQTSELVIEVEEETFAAKGKIVVDRGWKALYKPSKGDSDQELPDLKKGDKVQAAGTEVLKKQTSPPKPFTEASLLSAMEHAGRYIDDEALKEQMKESGFGTPATRAGIIERLLQVEYITRKGKALVPTPKGVKLVRIIPDELKSPEMTGKWERGLNKIAQGEMDPEKFMGSIKRFVGFLVQTANVRSGKVTFEASGQKKGKGQPKGEVFGTCPLCGDGKVLENSKSYYCSNWRSQCKFTVWKDALDRYGVKLDGAMMRKLLEEKTAGLLEVVMPQTGERRDGTLVLGSTGAPELRNLGPVKPKEDA